MGVLLMLQPASTSIKTKYPGIRQALRDIVQELHLWESAEDVLFYHIWMTDTGNYWSSYKKISDKKGQYQSCSSFNAPLIHFYESFSEIAGQNDFIIHQIYRPGNHPGFVTFRIECNKTLRHISMQE